MSPKIVVKRRRIAQASPAGAETLAADTSTSRPLPDAGDRRPRVFVVGQAGAGSGPAADGQQPALDRAASSRTKNQAEGGVPTRRTIRREPASDARRPGEVVVTRPQRLHEEAGDQGASVTLSELETRLEACSRMLADLTRDKPTWNFDLTFRERWSRVDLALDRLRDAVRTGIPGWGAD